MVSPQNENQIKLNDKNWLQTNNNPLAFSNSDNFKINPIASNDTLRQEFNNINNDNFQSSSQNTGSNNMNGSTNSFKNKKNKTDKPNINNKYNQMNYNKLTLKDNSYYT